MTVGVFDCAQPSTAETPTCAKETFKGIIFKPKQTVQITNCRVSDTNNPAIESIRSNSPQKYHMGYHSYAWIIVFMQ